MKNNGNKTESRNVYQMVTDRVIEQMRQGIIPWQRPWTGGGGCVNYVSRKPYSHLNQLLLGRPGEWLTFKQIQECGGHIKKGAKASFVVFYAQRVVSNTKHIKDEETGEERDEQVESLKPVLRYYNVFHIDDCEGIESKMQQGDDECKLQPVERAEQIIGGYVSREQGLKFINDKVTGSAYYSPATDTVVVPMMSQYEIVEEYYSTTFHELTHSTMTADRCDRSHDLKHAAFGTETYSREELVAELGSAMLCNIAGLDCAKAFKNSVAYIQGWSRKLMDDNRAIVWAAARAEKAARYIQGEGR